MRWFTGLVYVLAVLPGCNPEPLEIDGIGRPVPQIVVSSMILQDSTVCVILTRSVSAVEASGNMNYEELMAEVALNDARVEIRTGGKAFRLKLFRDGIYQHKEIPLVEGERYELFAESRSMGEISASAIMQPFVSFDTVSATVVHFPVENYWLDTRFGWTDPGGKNYYILSIQGASRKSLTERVVNPRATTRAIDDENFAGMPYQGDLLVTEKYFRFSDSIAFTLSNVSKEYFEYVQMRVENDLELVHYFAEPIEYPTNVAGGRGFFNMYYSDLRIVTAQ